MRKVLILPIVAALLFADFCAFGATARGGRSIANAITTSESTTENTDNITNTTGAGTAGNAAVAARAANRNRAKSTTSNTAGAARVATRTSVRSAVKPAVASQPVNQPTTQQQTSKSGSGVVARSATNKKAVNMGTKVAAATENTIIPEECKNAYNGCLDSFCMVANTSGGRCRCDERSQQFDVILDKIQKLDAQSKMLAEDGVERLNLGNTVDEIEAMAEEAANKVTAQQSKNQIDLFDTSAQNKKKSRTLDMSAFNNANLFDTDDMFDDLESDENDDLSDKRGKALYSAANGLCVPKMPQQCKEYVKMLQTLYTKQIGEDCIGYENDLKKQVMNSENLLRTAKKAIRDAASERYQADNKYNRGECIKEFKRCMTEDSKCGTGFSKCVVNPALMTESSSKKNNKSSSVKTITAGSITVEIDASTYSMLETFKGQCESVLDQCVKERDNVWPGFLQSVVAELRTAEIQAESDRLQNCATSVLDCVKTAAAKEGFSEGTESWDLFTSDPKLLDDICAPQIRQCAADNEELSKSIVAYVKRALDAKRVDSCTNAVRKCYQDKCGGEDYHLCVGLSLQNLAKMCVLDEVNNACMGKEGVDNVGAYIAAIGQSLILEINDALVKTCQKAVDKAMTEECNGTGTCTNSMIDFSSLWQQYLKYKICSGNTCIEDVGLLSDWQIEQKYDKNTRWVVKFDPAVTPADIYRTDNNIFSPSSTRRSSDQHAVSRAAGMLNEFYNNIVSNVRNDGTVKSCIEGNKFEGLDGVMQGNDIAYHNGQVAFPNLVSNIESVVAQSVYNKFVSQYNDRYQEIMDAAADANSTISSKYAATDQERKDACKQRAEEMKAASSETLQIVGVTWEWPAKCQSGQQGCRIKRTLKNCSDFDDGKCKSYEKGTEKSDCYPD